MLLTYKGFAAQNHFIIESICMVDYTRSRSVFEMVPNVMLWNEVNTTKLYYYATLLEDELDERKLRTVIPQFIYESKSERIIEIGPRLPKLQ